MVLLDCLLVIALHLQQMAADGVQPVMTGQRTAIERCELPEGSNRPVDHGERDDPVERHHRLSAMCSSSP